MIEEIEDLKKECLKDVKDIKLNMVINPVIHQFNSASSEVNIPIPTTIIALAISEDYSRNSIHAINCKKGKSLNNVIYDATRDVYLVECLDYHHVGGIPLSFYLEIEGILGFHINIPMPESTFKKYLTLNDKKQFDIWKESFNSKTVKFQFLQITHSY